MVTCGGVVSAVKVEEWWPVFPARSLICADRVLAPWPRVALPVKSAEAELGPTANRLVMSVPFEVTLKVEGLRSGSANVIFTCGLVVATKEPFTGAVMWMSGATLSIKKVIEAVAGFPALPLIAALRVWLPSAREDVVPVGPVAVVESASGLPSRVAWKVVRSNA